jgi:hypothetical protein
MRTFLSGALVPIVMTTGAMYHFALLVTLATILA